MLDKMNCLAVSSSAPHKQLLKLQNFSPSVPLLG